MRRTLAAIDADNRVRGYWCSLQRIRNGCNGHGGPAESVVKAQLLQALADRRKFRPARAPTH
jgi:hypothetical protein